MRYREATSDAIGSHLGLTFLPAWSIIIKRTVAIERRENFTTRFRRYGEEHKNDLERTGFGNPGFVLNRIPKGQAFDAWPFTFSLPCIHSDTSLTDQVVPSPVSIYASS